MDISRWTAQHADWSPDRVAVHFEGRDVTYALLEDRVGRLAALLRHELGIAPGDRVAHLGLNSPDLLALLFAAARIGALLVPLNWRLTPAEHAYMVANCAPKAIVAEPDYCEHVARIEHGLPALAKIAMGPLPGPPGWRSLDALATAAKPLAPDHARDLKSPVEIVYTSGTTGRPKGAVITQESIFYNAINSGAIFGMSANDRVLTALPMFHVGGMNIQTTPAIHWGATVILHRRVDPGAILADIAKRRPTLLLAVPPVSLALIAHPDWAKADLSSLKCVCAGSSTVPEAAIRPWFERGVPVTQVYGMTESGPIAVALSIADAARKIGSTGKPALHCEARIVREDGGDAAIGERGEIWMRGPNMLKEYWGDAAATRAAMAPGGWFKSGDIAHRDAEGFYYVDDRKGDMVISGGENVYPAELENVLADCAAIAEFAVVGRADPKWVEVPVACIVLKPGAALDRDAVLGLFEGRLARYKHPRDVIFLPGPLPRTSLGKVQKFALRRQLGYAD